MKRDIEKGMREDLYKDFILTIDWFSDHQTKDHLELTSVIIQIADIFPEQISSCPF